MSKLNITSMNLNRNAERRPHNRNCIKSVINLERALRAGRHPRDLGLTVIGAGVQNTAYLWRGNNKEFVVKSEVGGYNTGTKRPPKEIEKFGARAVRTWRAKGWLIQERVKVLCDTLQSEYPEAWESFSGVTRLDADIHMKNCGVDENGQLVVFDW